MKKLAWVGIDVSAKELVVALERAAGPLKESSFSNDGAGHRKLIQSLTRNGFRARVCVEATGVYHLDLCLALHGTQSIEVMLVNPRAAKDFHRAQLQRIDAGMGNPLADRHVRGQDGKFGQDRDRAGVRDALDGREVREALCELRISMNQFQRRLAQDLHLLLDRVDVSADTLLDRSTRIFDRTVQHAAGFSPGPG